MLLDVLIYSLASVGAGVVGAGVGWAIKEIIGRWAR